MMNVIIGNESLFPFIYDYMDDISKDGTRAIKKNNKWGLIEGKTGNTILENKYWYVGFLEEDGTRIIFIDENNYFEFNYNKWKILDKFIGEN